MDDVSGLLKITVVRGIKLAVRDARSSDPYVIVRMGKQKLKTRVVKNNVNPEWNEELTLTVTDPLLPIKFQVYDHDTFTPDDKMGDAELGVKEFMEVAKMDLESVPSGTVITKVKPTRDNFVCEESCIVWENGMVTQRLIGRLKNVECGEIELKLQWKKIKKILMDGVSGLLKITVVRGIKLAIRDVRSSDPYVIVRMGKQKLKTRVVKHNSNPEWNEELTLTVTDPFIPIKLQVYDHDTFTPDDKMGDAELWVKEFMEVVKMNLGSLPNGTVITKVKPTRDNFVCEESCIVWENGKVTQRLIGWLKNVECGEIELKLQWIQLKIPSTARVY